MPPASGPRRVKTKKVKVKAHTRRIPVGDTKSAKDLGRAKRYARTPAYRKTLRDVYDFGHTEHVRVGGAVEVPGRGRTTAAPSERLSLPVKRALAERQRIAHHLAATPLPGRVNNPVGTAILKLHQERVGRNREIERSAAKHDIIRPTDLVTAARELGRDENTRAMVTAAVERAKRETAGKSLKAQAQASQATVLAASMAAAKAKQKARELDPNAQRLNQKFRAQVLRILDYTARPLYATAGGIHAGLRGKNVLHAAGRGISGKDKTTYREVLHDVGVRGKGTGAVAFALDVLGDPITYLTAGLGSEARAAAEGAYHAALAGSRQSIENAGRKATEYALKRGVAEREARQMGIRARHVATLRARTRAAEAGRAAERTAVSARGLRAGVRVPAPVRAARRAGRAAATAQREGVSLRQGYRLTPRAGRTKTILLGNNITQALKGTRAGRAAAESRAAAIGRRNLAKIAPGVESVRSVSKTPIIDEIIGRSIGREYRVTRHRLENEARAHVKSYQREIAAHGLDEEAQRRIILAIDDGTVHNLQGAERTIANKIVEDLAKLGDTEVGLGIRQTIRANYFPRLVREGQRATEDINREAAHPSEGMMAPLMGKMGSSGRNITGTSFKQRSVENTLRELQGGTTQQRELFNRYVTSNVETPLLARATDSARAQALKNAQDRIAAELGREVSRSDLLDVGRLLDDARIYRKGRAGYRFLGLEDRDAAKAIRNYLDAKEFGVQAQVRKEGVKQARRDLAAARTAAKQAVKQAENKAQVDLRAGLRKEASIRQGLGEATGRAEVGSRNVAGSEGERAASREASRGRGQIRKIGKNAKPAEVLRYIQDIWDRGAHSFAAGGHGVLSKEELLAAHQGNEQLKRQANEALIAQAKAEGAAGVAHARKVLEDITKTKTIPSGTLVVIPPQSFERAFVHMGRGRSAPGTVNHLRAYDWLLGKTKTLQTVLNAPFFMTNMLGDTFNAKLADLDFGSMLRLPSLRMRLTEVERAQQTLERDAGRTLIAETRLGRKLPENFRLRPIREGKREHYPVYGEMSDLDVTKKAIEFGAVRTGQFGQEIRLLEAEATQQAGEGKLLGPVRAANEWREDIMRLGLFYDRLKKGDSFEQAVSVVNNHLFDYGELTETERKVLRRLIPYYTFFARNTKLQARMVFGKPGAYAAVESARVESAKSSGLNPDFAKVMAVYDQAGAPFILPTVKVNGNPVTVYTKLPLTDLSNFDVNPAYQVRNLLSRTASPIKSVIEQVTGRNLFFDQQYPAHVTAPAFLKPMLDMSPLPPQLKSHVGYIEGKDSGLYNPRTGKWDPGYNWRVDEVARNIPMYSTLANIFKAAQTPAGTGQRTAGLPFLLASQVLGPRTGVYDPTELLRTQVGERIGKLMKEREDVLRRRIPGAHARTHGRLREIQDELQKLYGVKYKLEKRAGFKHPGGTPPAKKKKISYGFATSTGSKKNPYGF